MARVIQRGPARLEPNLTPMVDVVFMLVVFFSVFAHIMNAERFELPLPHAQDASELVAPTERRRIVVSVAPLARAGELGGAYLVGGRAFAPGAPGLRELTEHLRESVAREPDAQIVVRAARDEPYERVHPALLAAEAAGAARAELALDPGAEPGAER
jgi:biopolymer transport protein ExbD